MPVYIDKIVFTDEYTGTPAGGSDSVGTPYLMGCVGDLIWATITCHVAWNTTGATCSFSSANKTITLIYCGSTLSATSGNVTNNSFIGLGFQVGDTIVVQGASYDAGTYTIKSLTDTVITVNESVSIDGVFSSVNIYGDTAIGALDFYYNLVPPKTPPNNAISTIFKQNQYNNNFNSYTDGSLQKFTGFETIYSGTFNMQPNSTSKAWWGNAASGTSLIPVITDNGIDGNYFHNYTIVFPFLITPFFAANQLQLLQGAYSEGNSYYLNGTNFTQPDYFTNQCLQFICKIDARFKIPSTVVDHSSLTTANFLSGNTSWFNTFFPSGIKEGNNLLLNTQYQLLSINYTDGSGNQLKSIDVNNTTNVKLKISGGTSWTSAPFVLNFMWLPTNSGEASGYSNNNQDSYRQVFLHDRCKTTVGHASVNGDMYGTSTQAITGVTSTIYNYGADLEIDFAINLGSLSRLTLNNDTQRNYLIWITPQDSSVTTLATAQRNAIIGDVNQAFVNTDDATLLNVITDSTSDIHFFNYGQVDIVPTTDFKNWSGEYGLAKCMFNLKAGTILQDISIVIEAQVYDGYGNTVAKFPLDTWTKSTSGFFDGTVNQININETRGYALKSGDLMNTRSIVRDSGADTVGFYAYKMYYGFQLGYQYWQNLPNFALEYEQYPVNYWSVFTQTFPSTYPSVISIGYTSAIKFKITWDVLCIATNVVTTFVRYANLASFDDGSAIGTNTIGIDTVDLFGVSQGGNILSDQPFQVVATIAGNNLVPTGGTTPVGELVLYWNDGTQVVYDRIMTDDTTPETKSSLWTGVPVLNFNAGYTAASLVGTLNLTQDQLKLTNASIYAKIIYK
jgi:hypothetical protein